MQQVTLIPIGGPLSWRPHHTWTDNETTWVDGQLVDERGSATGFDIAAASDEDAAEWWPAAAERAWDDGGVLCVTPYEDAPGLRALVVPGEALTTASIVEAFARFRP